MPYSEADFKRMETDLHFQRQYFWRVAMNWRRSGDIEGSDMLLGMIDQLVVAPDEGSKSATPTVRGVTV